MSAAAVAALAQPEAVLHGDLVVTQPPPEVREDLRSYFGRHYSEAASSAVYVDLNHDGAEELLVMELEDDRQGVPIVIHGGQMDPERFTAGTVTVLHAGEAGVETWMEKTFSPEEPGGLYLVWQDARPYLLGYVPRDGGTDFDMMLFSLDDTGQPVSVLQQTQCLTSGGDTAAELLSLLEQGSPVLACGTAPDDESRFAYLDELFTTYGD